jgi:hypothetical protein
MGLSVSDAAADQVRITWNRGSAPVLLARAGAIEILDGSTYRQALLTAEQLRAGSMTYRRESGTVEVHLRLESRWRNSALVRFEGAEPARDLALAAAVPNTAASVPEPSPRPTPPPAEGAAGRTKPSARRAAVIPDSVPKGIEPGPAAIPLPPLDPIDKPVAFATLPIPLAVLRLPTYSGPRSGRLIWTGSMARRGVVEIEGSRPSIGSLIGALPGVPVNVRVSPAEFSSGGLVVHSSDAAANRRRENPAAANGWNATVFEWDPERARALVVIEAPNPSNEFKRLVIRNDARTCPVIVVDWNVR